MGGAADVPRPGWVKCVDGAIFTAFAKDPDLLKKAWERCGLWPVSAEKAMEAAPKALQKERCGRRGGGGGHSGRRAARAEL